MDDLHRIGLGPEQFNVAIYLPHTPPSHFTQSLMTLRPLAEGELTTLITDGGNHWRKIINLAAKLGAALQPEWSLPWQDYRDQQLCRSTSDIALLFSAPPRIALDQAPRSSAPYGTRAVSIVCGHGYCGRCYDGVEFQAINEDFSVNRAYKLIDSPYFDYRQLSNVKLDCLAALTQSLLTSS